MNGIKMKTKRSKMQRRMMKKEILALMKRVPQKFQAEARETVQKFILVNSTINCTNKQKMWQELMDILKYYANKPLIETPKLLDTQGGLL